jgi:hypothetical protein
MTLPSSSATLAPPSGHFVATTRSKVQRGTFIAGMLKHFAERSTDRKQQGLDSAAADEQGVSRVLFVAHLARRGRDFSLAQLCLCAHDEMGLRCLPAHSMPQAELGTCPRIAEPSA